MQGSVDRGGSSSCQCCVKHSDFLLRDDDYTVLTQYQTALNQNVKLEQRLCSLITILVIKGMFKT